MSALLVRGGLVCTAGEAPRRADILIAHGRILRVAPDIDAPEAQVIDASDRIVMPGLVNSHTHGHANLAKGAADRWTLEASLTNGPWMGGARDEETVYLSTLLGAADMLSKGCTACFDLVYLLPGLEPAHLAAVARAYADAGMRAVLAPMVADRSFVESIPGLMQALPADLQAELTGPPPQAEDMLARLKALLAEPLPEGISCAVAPTIPHQCSDRLITGCAELAAGHDIPLHMHIAESRLQAEVARQVYGVSPIAHLDDLGVLGPSFVAAHAIWLDGDDLDRLARAGAAVAHIPASNFRLGTGIAPLGQMLDREMRVGLATDGANSSDALNMFEAMRLASDASRVWGTPRADWLSCAEAFQLGTEGGADVLGLTNAGRIAAGEDADLVLLDLGSVNFLPLTDPVAQLVTAENGTSVTDVIAAGRVVMREGRLTTIDMADLRERIEDKLPAWHAATAEARALSARMEPLIVAHVEGRAQPDLGFTRMVGEGPR